MVAEGAEKMHLRGLLLEWGATPRQPLCTMGCGHLTRGGGASDSLQRGQAFGMAEAEASIEAIKKAKEKSSQHIAATCYDD